MHDKGKLIAAIDAGTKRIRVVVCFTIIEYFRCYIFYTISKKKNPISYAPINIDIQIKATI